MKNLKRFEELTEALDAYYAAHGKDANKLAKMVRTRLNDAEENSKKIDELLNVIATTMDEEDDDEMSVKASILVVYMNLKLSKKDREAIKKNI